MGVLTIDTLRIAKRYKQAGMTEEQAEMQSEILKETTEEIFKKIKEDAENTKALTESKFLYEIEKLKVETKNSEIKIMTIIGSTFLILVGILAKGFHWF